MIKNKKVILIIFMCVIIGFTASLNAMTEPSITDEIIADEQTNTLLEEQSIVIIEEDTYDIDEIDVLNEMSTGSSNEPFSTNSRLEAHEIIVSNADEFRDAVENLNSYTTIYLGANIVLNGPVRISADKANITINGLDPTTNTRHSFEGYRSMNLNGGIYLADQVSFDTTITIKNLDIKSHNYYGMIAIYQHIANVTLLFDNITYTGPQLAYNVRGTLHINNGKVNIITQFAPAQEVAEINTLILEGNILFNHNVGGNSTYATFLFSDRSTSVTIKPNAQIIINSSNIFSQDRTLDNFTQERESSFKFTSTFKARPGDALIGGKGKLDLASATLFEIEQLSSLTTGNSLVDFSDGIEPSIINGAILNLKTLSSKSVNTRSLMNMNDLNMNNSEINIIQDKGVLESPLFKTKGHLAMDGSSLNIQAEGQSTTNVELINLNTFSMLNSQFNIKNNTKSNAYTVDSRQIQYNQLLSFNSSKIIVKMIEGTTVINFKEDLLLDKGSVIDFYSESLAFTMVIFEGNLIADRDSYLNIENVNTNLNEELLVIFNQDLSILDDSSFKIVLHEAVLTTYLIKFNKNEALLIIRNPKRVIFFNRNNYRVIKTDTNIKFEITTQQFNTWGAYTIGLYNPLSFKPGLQYKLINNKNFHIKGKVDYYTGTSVEPHNYTSADFANIDFKYIKLDDGAISMGYLHLDFNDPVELDTEHTGSVTLNSNVKVSYKHNNVDYDVYGTNDENGSFQVTTKPIDRGYITVTATNDYLHLQQSKRVKEVGRLRFVSVPNSIPYGNLDIPSKVQKYNTTNQNWNIEVRDDRSFFSNWVLTAEEVNPLASGDPSKEVLYGSLVFVDNWYQETTITSTPTEIARSDWGYQNITIRFGEDRGFMLKVNPIFLYNYTHYSGRIQLTLTSSP